MPARSLSTRTEGVQSTFVYGSSYQPFSFPLIVYFSVTQCPLSSVLCPLSYVLCPHTPGGLRRSVYCTGVRYETSYLLSLSDRIPVENNFSLTLLNMFIMTFIIEKYFLSWAAKTLEEDLRIESTLCFLWNSSIASLLTLKSWKYQ